MTGTFEDWFPYQSLAKRPGTAGYVAPKARLICLHGAGSDSTIFTSTVMNRKQVGNSLVDFCKDSNVHLYCPMLPGRLYRTKTPISATTTLISLAKEIFDILIPILLSDSAPFFLAGHSMGSIMAFELCHMLRNHRPSKLPAALFLSAGVPPTMPTCLRPWTPLSQCPARHLDPRVRADLRGFGIQDRGLQEDIWAVIGPGVVRDMELLDGYVSEAGRDKFIVGQKEGGIENVILMWAEKDEKITREMVSEWRDSFEQPNQNVPAGIEIACIPNSTHAIFYCPESREAWNAKVVGEIKRIIQTRAQIRESKSANKEISDAVKYEKVSALSNSNAVGQESSTAEDEGDDLLCCF